MRFALALFCAGILSSVADAQPMQLDPEAFGTLPVSKKQALVSNDTELGDGFVPAKDYRQGPIRIAANATGRLDLMYANGKRSGCTAVLISPSVIMTNAHCVPQKGPNRVTSIVFQTGFEDLNRTRRVEFLKVDPSAIEYHPSPVDTALLRLVDRSRRAEPIRFQISDPEPGETLFIVGHPKKAPKHVSLGHCFAADEPIDGVTMLHRCNTYGGNSGSFIFSLDRPNIVVGLHKWGATDGARYNMGTRMTRIASISPVFSEILGQDFVPLKPAPPKAIPGDPISMAAACDRYAAHPQNPDNPPSIVGVEWNDIVTTDAIAICDAVVSLLPKHARAKFNLARAYHKDGQYEIARDLYEQGIRRDYAASYNNLAALFDDGLGVDEDRQEASRLYEKAADLGHPSAALELGDRYRTARGKTRDYDKAMSFYEMAYKLGNMEAAAKIAWLFDKALGVPEDDAIAKKWYKIAAQSDVAWANNNIGVLYKEEKNYSLAKQAYERALELGNERYPNWNLAKLYENGWGVTRDYDRAEEFYRVAIAAGHPDAQSELGDLYRDREDGNQDYEIAREHYQAAWDSGDIEAAAKIAWLLDENRVSNGSKDKDAIDSHKLFELAADAEVGWAMANLGSNYLYGDGVRYDPVKAVEWYKKAIKTSPSLDWVYSRLGEAQINTLELPLDGAAARDAFEKGHELGDTLSTANLIALLARVPNTRSLADSTNYRGTVKEVNELRLSEANRAIAWAQAVGIFTEPLPVSASLETRLAMVARLPAPPDMLSDAATREFLLEAQARAKELLADHITFIAENPDALWAWGRLGGDTADLLTSLYSTEFCNRPKEADHTLRNRLLAVASARTARSYPDGPQWSTRKETVEQLQVRLENLGMSVGGVDGSVGPSTRRAVRQFQLAIGLEATGKLDPVTSWAVLKANELDLRCGETTVK